MQAFLTEYLPWVLSALTIAQSFFLGKKDIRGWVVGLVGQVGWSTWIVASATWGLLPLNIALWGLYTYNYRKWKRGDTTEDKLRQAHEEVALLNKFLEKYSLRNQELLVTVQDLREQLRAATAPAQRAAGQQNRQPQIQRGYVADNGTLAGVERSKAVYQPETTPAPYTPWPFPTGEYVAIQRQEPQFMAGGAVAAFAGGGASGAFSDPTPAPSPSVSSCSASDSGSSSSSYDSSSSGSSDCSSSSGGTSGTSD